MKGRWEEGARGKRNGDGRKVKRQRQRMEGMWKYGRMRERARKGNDGPF